MENEAQKCFPNKGKQNEKSTKIEIDTLLKLQRFIERGGRWQALQFFAIFMCCFGTDVQTLSIAFTGFQPKFGCIGSDNGGNYSTDDNFTFAFDDQCTVLNSATNTSSACGGGFRYDAGKHETIVAQWDLICDKAYLSEVSQLLYIVGMALGSAVATPISDRFGRKGSFMVMRVLYIFCVFGLALSPNIVVFMVLRLLTGTLGMGLSLVRFVYMMELSPVHQRPLVTIMTGLLWAVSLLIESGVAQAMRGMNWRYFQAVVSIPTLTIFLDIAFLKESLLWLYANGKEKEASRLLETAMKTNGITEQTLISPEDKNLNLDSNATSDRGDNRLGCEEDVDSKVETRKPEFRKLNIIDILKNKATRKLVPIVCFAWFVNSLVYYGIFLMSYAMAGDRVLNFFLSAVVEIPSYLALFVFLKWLGRKKPLVGLHGLCAVSLLLAGIFNFTLSGSTKVIVMQVVTSIGKFGISASFMMLFIYTSEVFPTNFRASGLGMGSASARMGSFLSPFSSVLVRKLPWAPGIIFGGLCLVLTCILFVAPETRHRNLPQTLEEIEAWETDKKEGTKRKKEMASKPA